MPQHNMPSPEINKVTVMFSEKSTLADAQDNDFKIAKL